MQWGVLMETAEGPRLASQTWGTRCLFDTAGTSHYLRSVPSAFCTLLCFTLYVK